MAMQYVHDDTGTYIPATQRPDGSWRKARRVKDGYIPQDEMPLYESKGKQWAKSKPTLPIGLDPIYTTTSPDIRPTTKTIPGLDNSHNSVTTTVTSSKKKKKKKSDSTSKPKEIVDGIEKLNLSSTQKTDSSNSNDKKNQPVATDPAKRLRNLKKKLKDINALKLKIDRGELTNPDKDQLEKVRRKEEIEAEIDDLELQLNI